jgi:hypothetical protein
LPGASELSELDHPARKHGQMSSREPTQFWHPKLPIQGGGVLSVAETALPSIPTEIHASGRSFWFYRLILAWLLLNVVAAVGIRVRVGRRFEKSGLVPIQSIYDVQSSDAGESFKPSPLGAKMPKEGRNPKVSARAEF